jgi:hypothetical protein
VYGSTVVLAWAAPTVFPAKSYVLEAGSVSGAANLANQNIGRDLTFTASPVPPGVYYVRVRAFGSGALSAASNEIVLSVGQSSGGCASAAAPPRGLTFSVRGNDVMLHWGHGGDGDTTSYVVEAGSYSGASNLATIDTMSTETSLYAAGVGDGTYFVRVRGKNKCGVTTSSNEIMIKVGR